MAVAVVLFGAGALRTSHQAGTDHMAGSVGLALGGALLVALVAAVMVAQLRASVEQRKLAVFGNWLTVATAAPEPVSPVGPAVFVVAGLPLYHRDGCQLLDGRSVTEVPRTALASDATACRLCEPA
jgi:hypothetical protein